MNYTLVKIAEIVGGQLDGPETGIVGQIITDSRGVSHTSNSLFIALVGPNHDGHDYIPDLIDKGVNSFVVDHRFDTGSLSDSACFIVVPDTLKALQNIASWHRSTFSGDVIGITGSNGKTVVKEWLSQLLSGHLRISRSPKSYNSQIGVPLSILMMDPGPDYHIIEAGISLPGEMRALEKMIKPDIGIFTNVGDAHQENFESLEAKLDEKLDLFKNSGLIIYCRDNPIVADKIESRFLSESTELLSWSTTGDADLRILKTKSDGQHTVVRGVFNSKEHLLDVPFTDKASVENIINIWAFWLKKGYPAVKFQDGINELEPVAMRMEQKEGFRGCTLINDFYNADFNSLSISLDLLMNQLPQKKKSLIISDLLQTGLSELELVNRFNKLLGDKDLYRIIGIGSFFSDWATGFNFDCETYTDTEKFLNKFSFTDFCDEAILIKGARKFKFERISRKIEKSVHKTVVEISMTNLSHNLNFFRSKLLPGTKIMAMVKAFSYGSGTHEIAKFLSHQRIDYLGVAFTDEGIMLREAGIDTPIMVMNPDAASFDSLIEQKLEPELYSLKVLNEFCKSVSRSSFKAYPVHLKIDTGMHRLGFQPEEFDEIISILENNPAIEVRSVFSHFTSADIPENDDFSHKQARIFEDFCKKLRNRLDIDFISHISNSSAIQRFPEYQYDMVRLGIGLYGLNQLVKDQLKSVISMKTVISQIHNLKKGDTVGYGNSQEMGNDGRIAVIPVGYADGLDRRLGNGVGRLICNGSIAPTIGNICMDMSMINISGINASVGDEVVIFGDEAPLSDMASALNSITYEVITRIPQRVKRVFLFE